MSRRKQEKPQPRKNVIRGEADTIDILTCGACRKDFPLADIVRFIQHKVQLCNKENCLFDDSEEDEDGGQDPPAVLIPPPLSIKKEDGEDPLVSSTAILKKAITAKDTSSNTNSTALEPRSYVCSTCKQSLTSAWALILHVQNAHGLSICLDSSSDTKVSSLRAPLLERQPELFPTRSTNPSSQQELRLDLIGCGNTTKSSPPLLELSGCEPDFYSQRLRVLAGATSPSAPRQLPPQPSTFKTLLGASTPPESNSPEKSQSAALNSSASSSSETEKSKAKNRLCEYCGKSFQFKSNLIVHRRSHTGEKPFKCHICNHACTQASKLKRHMKTHRFKNPPSDELPEHLRNGKAEGEDAPKMNGKMNGDGESADEEADDEEIDIEEEEVDEDEEELVVDSLEEDEYPRENGGGKLVIVADEAEDLTKKPTNGVENGKRKLPQHSIVSEFMENVGLANIPQYSEAFKQALKENTYRNAIKQERCGADGSASNDAYALLPYLARPPRDGTRSAGQSPLNFSSGVLEDMKRRRMDAEEHFMYAGVWYPRSEEGSKKSSESAFNDNNGGLPGPSFALVKQGNNKDPSQQRRNDTCEYCGKVFKNCSNLTVHRRSHTGEKPYKCELCSYACAQSSKLTRHMKTHGRLGKDVYRCRFCDMPFSVPSTLEKHMRKCVVSQSGGGSPYVVSERDSDSKEMITFYETP